MLPHTGFAMVAREIMQHLGRRTKSTVKSPVNLRSNHQSDTKVVNCKSVDGKIDSGNFETQPSVRHQSIVDRVFGMQTSAMYTAQLPPQNQLVHGTISKSCWENQKCGKVETETITKRDTNMYDGDKYNVDLAIWGKGTGNGAM